MLPAPTGTATTRRLAQKVVGSVRTLKAGFRRFGMRHHRGTPVTAPGVNQSAVSSLLGSVPRLLPGLALLWQARDAAPRESPHENAAAVTGSALGAAGLTRSDVEFLIEQGCADVKANGVRRNAGFGRPPVDDMLSEHTEFVLTPTGAILIEQFLRAFGEFRSRVDRPRRPVGHLTHVVRKPRWDRLHRKLHFGHVLVKRFRNPAPNQELLLAAFEESGWPEDVADPLPPLDRGSPVPRLQHTLQRLNSTLLRPVIRFALDPSGRRVTWRCVGSTDGPAPVWGVDWGMLIG